MRLQVPGLANPGTQLRIQYDDDHADQIVTVIDIIEDARHGRGAKVRYQDGNYGVLWDESHEGENDPEIWVELSRR